MLFEEKEKVKKWEVWLDNRQAFMNRIGKPDKALPVLINTLRGPHPWGRLQAAIVLDGIGQQARPAEDALKEALTGQPNKYITRVANRALNVMNGTNNVVP